MEEKRKKRTTVWLLLLGCLYLAAGVTACSSAGNEQDAGTEPDADAGQDAGDEPDGDAGPDAGDEPDAGGEPGADPGYGDDGGAGDDPGPGDGADAGPGDDGNTDTEHGSTLTIVNYRGHADPEPADWIGVRFDQGSWFQVEPGGGRATVPLVGDETSFTVAIVCTSSSNTEVHLFSALLAEVDSVINNCRTPADGWYSYLTHHVEYANFEEEHCARSSAGARQGVGCSTGTYGMILFPGRYDMVHMTGVEGYGSYPPPCDRVIIDRAVQTDPENTMNVDFDTSTSTITFRVLANNFPSGPDVYFVTAGGTFSSITPISADYGNNVPCAGIPASLRIPGDVHLVHTPYIDRETFLFFAEPGDIEYDFEVPDLEAPTVTPVGEPWSGRLSVEWIPLEDVRGMLFNTRNDPNGDRTPEWAAFVSEGWLGGEATYVQPDFSQAPGFDPEWSMQAAYMRWILGAVITEGSVDQLIGSALTVPSRPMSYQNYHRFRPGVTTDGLRIDLATEYGYHSP